MEMISALLAGTLELVPPTPLAQKELNEIPKLFTMPGFPAKTQQFWEDFIANLINEQIVPANYFDFNSLCLQHTVPTNFVIELPPSDFNITTGSDYHFDSSLVCDFFYLFFYEKHLRSSWGDFILFLPFLILLYRLVTHFQKI